MIKDTIQVIDLEIPDLGDSEDIELVKWHVKLNSLVRKGDELAEITTQKVVFTLEAPANGKIIEICIEEGNKVKKGQIAGKLSLE